MAAQLSCLIVTVPALAGQIEIRDGRVPVVSVGGRIDRGDEIAFPPHRHERIQRAGGPDRPGGDVAAALAIAREVRAPRLANPGASRSLLRIRLCTYLAGWDAANAWGERAHRVPRYRRQKR